MACDSPAAHLQNPGDCALVVVASDYSSTAISLLHADGTLCAPDVLTSGSRPPGLLTALSGDVVLPSSPSPAGDILLLDRFPNAVLTTVDAATASVRNQLRLSPAFPGNPQDLVDAPDDDLLIVSRLEAHKTDDLGSDLALFRRSDHTPLGRVDLAPFADPGFDPMPTRFANAHGLLWVGLTHLERDFTTAGPGRVLAFERHGTTLTAVARGELPTLQNCGHLAATPNRDALWVVCSGLFRDSVAPRIDRSGLARFGAPPLAAPLTTLSPDRLIPATILGRPLGFTIAPISADTVAAVLLGDLTTQAPDQLVLVTATASAPPTFTLLAEAATFDLGGLLYLAESDLLLVADGNPRNPRLRRFTLGTTPAELPPISISPSGLPPRHLQRVHPQRP